MSAKSGVSDVSLGTLVVGHAMRATRRAWIVVPVADAMRIAAVAT
jgi:hypothetical protein